MGRTPKDSITIADVARAAEVSRATVSRVMNGRLGVAPEIVARVRAAAEQLNYRPSDLARSLSLGRTNDNSAHHRDWKEFGVGKAIQ